MDYRLEQWINGPAGHHPILDSLMVHAAGWGQAIFIAVVALWFVVGWFWGSPTDRRGAITALLAAGGALLANQLVLHLWTRPRPFIAHPAAVHLLLAHTADPSFPSDHAAPAFAIALVLFAFHRRLGALALLFAALMSYARVYDGVHYPGDVTGGALIGLAVALVLLTWLAPVMERLRRMGDRAIRFFRLPLPA